MLQAASAGAIPPEDWVHVCKDVLELSQPVRSYVAPPALVQGASSHIQAAYMNKELFLEEFVAQELARSSGVLRIAR